MGVKVSCLYTEKLVRKEIKLRTQGENGYIVQLYDTIIVGWYNFQLIVFQSVDEGKQVPKTVCNDLKNEDMGLKLILIFLEQIIITTCIDFH